MPYTFYGEYSDANEYMLNAKLHNKAWVKADLDKRQRALIAASNLIDQLNFRGDKHSVWQAGQDNPDATTSELLSADAGQDREFPRDADTEVPANIKKATWEIAYELLDGRDPQLDLETLAVVSQGYSSVRTTYQRDVPLDHMKNFIPSALAWRWLVPFLRDENQLNLARG